jgi:hypothetical protein
MWITTFVMRFFPYKYKVDHLINGTGITKIMDGIPPTCKNMRVVFPPKNVIPLLVSIKRTIKTIT